MKQSLWYAGGKQCLWSGVDLATAKIRCALMTEAYKPSAKHKFYRDLTGECRGDGYTPGGPLLTGQRLETRDGDCRFHAADIVIPECSIEADGVALYHDASGTLIAYIAARKPDHGRNMDFAVEWHGEPILTY